MDKTVVINVVGLTYSLIGEHTPFLSSWIKNRNLHFIKPAFPAVTCTAQANYLTGKKPSSHGIVGNGWYFKDECEVKFWKQSNKLVQQPKIWDVAKCLNPEFTCANLFWWYNMYSGVDYSVTPRPQYLSNGIKLPDCYTYPDNLREELQAELGTFPLFQFWGPATSIKSSQWIAESAMIVDEKYDPTLSLIYLPHLDYSLQKYGTQDTRVFNDLREIDKVCEGLVNYFNSRADKIVILSEYGITDVNNPIHINRILREYGFLRVRRESHGEILDAGASEAFAVADHQIAHIYVNNPARYKEVAELLRHIPGVAKVLDDETKNDLRINHERAGDFIIMADKKSWFTYYYWMDDNMAPDFARTVDIHKKPGYDPVEMFIDPAIRYPKLKIGEKLLKKKLGFRTMMDIIPLDASLIKGSHGRFTLDKSEMPVFISTEKTFMPPVIDSTEVFNVLLNQLFPSYSYSSTVTLPSMT
ncbi:MAG: alkaline phosphatase family protein [Cytophagaceae bacterium]